MRDHAGSLAHVQAALNVPVIASVYEVPHLQSGKTSVLMPQGTTMADLVKSIGLSAQDRFNGRIKVLPGHTPGSLCVFTPDDIICGDTVFNVSASHFPPIYNDKEALLAFRSQLWLLGHWR